MNWISAFKNLLKFGQLKPSPYECYLITTQKLARKIGAAQDQIPTTAIPEEGFFIKVEGKRLALCNIERGEIRVELLASADEVIAEVIEQLAFSLSIQFEAKNRKANEDYRRQLFSHQESLLRKANPKWGDEFLKSVEGYLLSAPFDDNYDRRMRHQAKLEESGVPKDQACAESKKLFPVPESKVMDAKAVAQLARAEAAILDTHKDSEVAKYRQNQFLAIAQYLETNGFPHWEKDKLKLSLIPIYFQEANYDDIGWWNQSEELRHLSKPLEVDFAVMTGGYTRSQAPKRLFRSYVSLCNRAIEAASK